MSVEFPDIRKRLNYGIIFYKNTRVNSFISNILKNPWFRETEQYVIDFNFKLIQLRIVISTFMDAKFVEEY